MWAPVQHRTQNRIAIEVIAHETVIGAESNHRDSLSRTLFRIEVLAMSLNAFDGGLEFLSHNSATSPLLCA